VKLIKDIIFGEVRILGAPRDVRTLGEPVEVENTRRT